MGGGEITSADGLRLITPVKSVHSGPNPKYFGSGRGVTYYNYTSDQFTGLHGLVIPGTIRDSLYLLQCVLEQNTNLQPKEIMKDTAGYSDIIFGLFGLLGYQFSPRLADISKSRLWRFDVNSDYGILNNLSKSRIREELIHRHWEDMLRVAGSLKLNKRGCCKTKINMQCYESEKLAEHAVDSDFDHTNEAVPALYL